MAYDECVNAPGLITIASHRPRAPWIASTRSPSWFDCTCSSSCPAPSATARASATQSSSVAVPYTSGSRSPSRFRLGPETSRISIVASGFHRRERGVERARRRVVDDLETVRSREHEREAALGLLVALHHLQEVFPARVPGDRDRQPEPRDDAVHAVDDVEP